MQKNIQHPIHIIHNTILLSTKNVEVDKIKDVLTKLLQNADAAIADLAFFHLHIH